jgi:hypothetical protein
MRGNLPPATLFGFFWVRRSASRKPPRLGFIKRTVLFFCRGKISDTMRIVTANIRLAARFPGASKKLVTVGQLITDRERLRAGLLPRAVPRSHSDVFFEIPTLGTGTATTTREVPLSRTEFLKDGRVFVLVRKNGGRGGTYYRPTADF